MPKFRRKPLLRIDFDAIYAAADVRNVAAAYLEKAQGRPGRFVCPMCGKGHVTAQPKVWSCWSCGAHSGRADAVGLVSLVTGTSRIDAGKRLAGELGIGPMVATAAPGRPGQRPAVQPKPPEPEPYELDSWVRGLAVELLASRDRLLSHEDDDSRRAWDYLTGERGLTPEMIDAARLGFNPRWVKFHEPLPGEEKPCKLPPGIVIPWLAGPNYVAGANVRQFHVELRDKYVMAKGSRRRWVYPSLRNWEDWTGPVIVVEGEFDALLANQELSSLLPVVTLGGAMCQPSDTLDAPRLGRFSRLLIAADNDAAGQECRDMWLDFSPRRAVSVDLPSGKDLTEAHAAGHDLRRWLDDTCKGLGIDLRALPGLVWEMPLGTIRGRLMKRADDAESAAEAAAELAAVMAE